MACQVSLIMSPIDLSNKLKKYTDDLKEIEAQALKVADKTTAEMKKDSLVNQKLIEKLAELDNAYHESTYKVVDRVLVTALELLKLSLPAMVVVYGIDASKVGTLVFNLKYVTFGFLCLSILAFIIVAGCIIVLKIINGGINSDVKYYKGLYQKNYDLQVDYIKKMMEYDRLKLVDLRKKINEIKTFLDSLDKQE
jgi:hypothetical protein